MLYYKCSSLEQDTLELKVMQDEDKQFFLKEPLPIYSDSTTICIERADSKTFEL